MQGPGRGAGAARAPGVRSSQSPFIATHDADDLSDPRRLEKQMAYMNANPKCIIVGSWARKIDENGWLIGSIEWPKATKPIRLALNFNNPFVHSATLLRKDAVLKTGNYNDGGTIILCNDYELWSRMAPFGDLHNIQEPLVSYRVNSTGVTGTQGIAMGRQACSIAIRTTEASLSRRLSDPDRQLFSLFFGRHHRISVTEAFHLYRILLRLFVSTGYPRPRRGISWRRWLALIVWIVRAPQQSTALWEKDEIPEIS